MANVLLVNAPHTDDGEEVRRFSRPWPPLDLLNCAAILSADGHGVDLLDYRAQRPSPEWRDRAVDGADRVVITTTPLDRWQCPTLNTAAVFDFIRGFPATRTWVMGAHATMQPGWVLEETGVAGLILGEPEGAIRSIMDEGASQGAPGLAVVRDGVLRAERLSPLDMTELPVPEFGLLEMERYRYELLGDRFMIFEAARGCPFGCTFCSREMYGKPVRRKATGQVLEELERARAQTAFRCAYFIDLEFTFHREPIVELCEGILERRLQFDWACQTRFDQVDEELLLLMRGAGCRLIHFGVETGSERQVRALKKGLSLEQIEEQHELVQRCGIETALFFLIGHPRETPEEQRQTIELACRLDPDYASFNIASPYPGTAFHEQVVSANGAPFPAHDAGSHDLDDLEAMRRYALRRFYGRPAYLARQLHPRRLGRALSGARLLMRLLS